MSLYDYQKSLKIAGANYSFYAIVMAAIRQADSDNLELLKQAFPETFSELYTRYHSPGGRLCTAPD